MEGRGWTQQQRLFYERNETLLTKLEKKEKDWESQKNELVARNEQLLKALSESERKLKVQHKALTERCEVLLAALESKYAEDKKPDIKGSDTVSSERVNINVGGQIFSTVRETLIRNDFRLERWPLHSDGARFQFINCYYANFSMLEQAVTSWTATHKSSP